MPSLIASDAMDPQIGAMEPPLPMDYHPVAFIPRGLKCLVNCNTTVWGLLLTKAAEIGVAAEMIELFFTKEGR